jgi:chaperonin GroEL
MRLSFLEGISDLSRAVGKTLGPGGRNVIIPSKLSPYSRITKDGVSVSGKVSSPSRLSKLGIRVIQECATRCVHEAGDGTSTATILAEAIYRKGLLHLSAGCNGILLKEGISKACELVLADLEKHKRSITSIDELEKLAYLCSNGDNQVATLLAKAYEKVGFGGTIHAMESKTHLTSIEVINGVRIDSGHVYRSFINNDKNMSCELIDPYVFISDTKIAGASEIFKIAEFCAKQSRPLLLIAHSFHPEAIALLNVNKDKGILKCCAIHAPGYGAERTSILKDIELLTGATLHCPEQGFNAGFITPEILGTLSKVTVYYDHTIMVGNNANSGVLKSTIERLKSELRSNNHELERIDLEKRLMRLESGICVLYVGGDNEVERTELYDRVEDALRSTVSAIDSGILPGGGCAYLRSREVLKRENLPEGYREGDRYWGVKILYDSLYEPFERILRNSGASVDYIYRKLMEVDDYWLGYNCRSGVMENMYSSGVFDSVKTLKSALLYSSSSAGMLLTCGCSVVLNEVKGGDSEE